MRSWAAEQLCDLTSSGAGDNRSVDVGAEEVAGGRVRLSVEKT